ncbi:MAG: hypothetical protein ACJA2S_003875, partial [Cyclobacteriaceae bacterium]
RKYPQAEVDFTLSKNPLPWVYLFNCSIDKLN